MKRLLIVFVIASLMLSGFAFSVEAGCCLKSKCACSDGTCCVGGKCECEGACCKGEACRCGDVGVCGKCFCSKK